MGLITTQHAGFGQNKPDPKQAANPKPVRGFNYAGEPMKPGDFYNGRPEHQRPDGYNIPVRTPKSERPPEYIAMMRERARKSVAGTKAYWARKRAEKAAKAEKQKKATPESASG